MWRDVRAGYQYLVAHGDQWAEVTVHGHQGVAALLANGTDAIADLPDGSDPHADLDLSRIEMVETYPDLYLTMREQ